MCKSGAVAAIQNIIGTEYTRLAADVLLSCGTVASLLDSSG